MNAVVALPHPMTAAMLQAQHDLDRELIRLLYDARPMRVTVSEAMELLGIEPDAQQGHRQEREFQACLAFNISRARVARILPSHGFEIQRSGGTVADEIWIESVQRASS